MRKQTTIKNIAHFNGIGLHTGEPCAVTLRPAPVDFGIRILHGQRALSLGPAAVVDTRYATHLEFDGRIVSTVEHLLSAIYGNNVDNLLISIEGREVPIMDGSAVDFSSALRDTLCLEKEPEILRVEKSFSLNLGQSRVEVSPRAGFLLEVHVDTPFGTRETKILDVTPESYHEHVSWARTYVEKRDIELLRSFDLIKGGSLDNAIVIDNGVVLNDTGLRHPDEIVTHKILDVIGDLAFIGARLQAHVKIVRPGHTINNLLARSLFTLRSAAVKDFNSDRQVDAAAAA